jgi:glucosamine-6-phosphate deaminase
MKDLLASQRIRLYSVTGPMKATILRILLFSEPTVQFPATLVHGHPDVEVVVEAAATQCPLPALR